MGKEKTINILFCGTGGQGVLKASEVCALAAVFSGFHVKKSEVHGMAQRGGSVESHLRFGKKVFSTLIPFGEADFLVSFHKEESVRLEGFLRPSGHNLEKYLDKAKTSIPDKRYLNIFLLGILSCYLSLPEKNWQRAIETVFSSKNLNENKNIFLKGRRERL